MHDASAALCIPTQPPYRYESPMRKQMTAVALIGLWSCTPGGMRPGTAAPGSPGDELPGWYDVPAEPANVFSGEARLRIVEGRLQGDLTLAPGEGPLYFAIKTQGWEPQAITEVIDPAVSTSFTSAPFSCRRAEATLLAYSLRPGATTPDPTLDELIGVAFKPSWLFPYQQSAYNQRLTERSCAAGGELLPMQLQHDPRLRLALCDTADSRSALVCGQAPLDRTRVHAISLSVDEDGRVFLAPNFVVFVDEPVEYRINGAAFPASAGQLDSRLAAGLWRAGRNTVEIRQGSLPPWSAEVVLPMRSLHPRLHEAGLRAGAPFTMSWDAAPWAQAYRVTSAPLEVNAGRVAFPSWWTEQPSLNETFPGFRNGNGDPLSAERAELMVTVAAATAGVGEFAPFHSSGGYSVSWTEQLEVAVLP